MVWLLGTPLFLFAQESEELNTDRPTRAQSPAVIPRGTLQIETGFEFQKKHSEAGDQKEYLDPTTLIRIGILKKMELRLNADLKKERTEALAGAESKNKLGFNDVMVGAKVQLYEGKGAIPQVSFLGNVTLPVGDKEFRPPHAAPEGRLLFSSALSDKVELQYNLGYRKHRDHEEYRGEALYAVTGDLKLTDKLTYFAEIAGQKPHLGKAEHLADMGFLFKLLPNLQLDVIGALGLNEEAPDYFAGGGITWRIPR
ncbi:hypothetical protein AAE02nite_46260 [Adhaeribacter aerolatus]|uniref:Transporter n=2 Tax=Adhaeribacter aerolatus TaxID=670289 RepID=A0A512B4U4_9BACT|nr:hypothetical protein AAE02nite_46260 [Adhaeribacter aerolatus]